MQAPLILNHDDLSWLLPTPIVRPMNGWDGIMVSWEHGSMVSWYPTR